MSTAVRKNKIVNRYAKSKRLRRAFSLIELVVAMSLLMVLMLPVIGLLSTSYKVYNASSTRAGGDGSRRAALDALSLRLQSAVRTTAAASNAVTVQLANGSTARLSYAGGRLFWREGGVTQTLVAGLSNARFSVGAATGATATAGELLLVEVATRATNEPAESWSSTRI